MWTQIANTRKICLWLWLPFTALLTTLTLVQTALEKLGEASATAWIWVFMLLWPGLALLFISVLLNRRPSNIIPLAAHRALWIGTLGYLLLASVTLLAEPVALRSGVSIQAYLYQSYWWLLPFNLLLLLGFWLIFVRQNPIFLPDEKIILGLVATQAESWRKKGLTPQGRSLEEIAQGNISAALDILKTHFETENRSPNDLILLQGQYQQLLRNKDLNLIEPSAAQLQLNKITMAVLNLIKSA